MADQESSQSNNPLDPSDPYYIHPADNLAITTPFNGKYFGAWKKSMLIALTSKNKVGFVNGEIKKPKEDHPKFRQWQRCNFVVCSWIVNSLSSDMAENVIYFETAEEMWKELTRMFEQYNGVQLYRIQDQLNQIYHGFDSISDYFTKLKSTWEELDCIWRFPVCKCGCTCGAYDTIVKHDRDQKVIRYLMGINESYMVIKHNILMKKSIPSIDEVHALLIQEETFREALFTGNSGGYQSQSSNYNRTSGFQNNRNRSYRPTPAFSERRNRYFCTECQMEGHSNERCYILHPELRNQRNGRRKAAAIKM